MVLVLSAAEAATTSRTALTASSSATNRCSLLVLVLVQFVQSMASCTFVFKHWSVTCGGLNPLDASGPEEDKHEIFCPISHGRLEEQGDEWTTKTCDDDYSNTPAELCRRTGLSDVRRLAVLSPDCRLSLSFPPLLYLRFFLCRKVQTLGFQFFFLYWFTPVWYSPVLSGTLYLKKKLAHKLYSTFRDVFRCPKVLTLGFQNVDL